MVKANNRNMGDLKTNFAGLDLRNPIIISSCGRTAKAVNNKAFEDAGAAAVVLKSLFEENISLQADSMTDEFGHAEAADYMHGYLRSNMLQEYIELIRESKRLCTIPIIASINCYSVGEWADFAGLIEKAGADALELNVMDISTAKDAADGDFERKHVEILDAVRKIVKIPIIVKLGSNLSNPVSLIERLYAHGANAVVLFNRFYQTDIDIEKMEYTSGSVFSAASDLATPLRWTGIVSAAVRNIDIAVSGGVHDGAAVVKSILAGASAAEVCSAVYQNGSEWIGASLEYLANWMELHNFASVSEFCGRLNAADPAHASRLERTQFLRYFEAVK